MRVRKILDFLKRFGKFFTPVLVCFSLFAVSVISVESFSPFFEKLTIISAAAAMPKAATEVVIDSLKTQSYDDTEQSFNSEPPQIEEEQKEEISSEQGETTNEKPTGAGKISEYAIVPSKTSSKIVWYGGAAFSNTSKTSNSEILNILKQTPNIKLYEGKPQVLIYHTHATESYEMKDLGYYLNGSSARTQDEKKNMIRVGEEIAAQLEAANIGVIHDKSLYDYPSYNGAYNRSADTVKKYLEKYPSITITLDIHRDAIEQSGAVRVKPTAEINGKKAAQVMIIAGVDDGTMDFPNWRENMKFASSLQRKMEQDYTGLTRAAMVCHRRYNMYLTNNSLLIEVGGHANTLDEAVYSGELIGKSLVNVLKEYGTD